MRRNELLGRVAKLYKEGKSNPMFVMYLDGSKTCQVNGPNHFGFSSTALPRLKMALITSNYGSGLPTPPSSRTSRSGISICSARSRLAG